MGANRVEFVVPLLPPSLNHLWLPNKRGGFRKCPAAKAFSDAVYLLSRQAGSVAGKFYSVELEFSIARERFLRCDADNFEKVTFDSLKEAHIISDDRYILRHTNTKLAVPSRREEQTRFVVSAFVSDDSSRPHDDLRSDWPPVPPPPAPPPLRIKRSR